MSASQVAGISPHVVDLALDKIVELNYLSRLLKIS
jgi:hypothetical protein